jgi:hypothetical protein
MTRLTNMDNTVNIIVRRGVIDGSMLCSSSPTMPAVKAASLATLLIDRPKYDPNILKVKEKNKMITLHTELTYQF